MSSAKTDGDLSRRSLKLKPTFDQGLPSMVCMLPTGQDTGLHATDIKMVFITGATSPPITRKHTPRVYAEGSADWICVQGSNGSRALRPVLCILVVDQKSRSRSKQKRFSQLLDDPTAGRMARDVEVQDTSAIMADGQRLKKPSWDFV